MEDTCSGSLLLYLTDIQGILRTCSSHAVLLFLAAFSYQGLVSKSCFSKCAHIVRCC